MKKISARKRYRLSILLIRAGYQPGTDFEFCQRKQMFIIGGRSVKPTLQSIRRTLCK